MNLSRPDPLTSLWLADPTETQYLSMTLADSLRISASQWAEREAVVSAAEPGLPAVRWTYEQLDQKVSRLAASLLAQGYQAGDRIAVWGPSYPEWILIEYAISRAGLVLVTLNPLYKQAELLYALQAAAVSAIFHADEVSGVALSTVIAQVATDIPTLRGIYSFSNGLTKLLEEAPAFIELPAVDPTKLFMIQYTSGTTGQPKAAQMSHQSIITSASNTHRRWEVTSGDRVCHGFPMFHIGGSGCCTPGAILMGATTLPLRVFKADRALDLLEHERCRLFIGVPTMITAMLEHPSFKSRDLSALKMLIIGGAPVPIPMIHTWEEAFGAQVINSYGQTETSGVSTSCRAHDPADKKATTSGVAVPGVSLKVVDQAGAVVSHGVPGELCFQGPGRMIGYRNDTQHVGAIDADGWFHSGDLATMDSQGFIKIVGRAREMIIRGGENLSPVEMENLILQHPLVSQVAVVGVPDAKYGEEACAAVILKPESRLVADELRAWCLERISRWKVPRYVVFIDTLPLTPSGKVKKFILRDQMKASLSLVD